jgi:predicted permease
MKWLNIIIARLHGAMRRESVIRDIDEELSSHIAMETEANIEKGLTPEVARQTALRSFGNLGRVREVAYEVRGGGALETVGQDLRYGARTLLENPGFTVTAVIALALGIGATTAIFSVVHAVLLQKLPYPEHDRIVMVWSQNLALSGETRLPNTPGEYNLWREQRNLFEASALFDSTRFSVTGNFDSFSVGGALVTREFFAAFGVAPYLGRTFTEREERPGNEQVAVISYNLWATHFGSDPRILGKDIQFSGRDFRIVGVMPQGFHFPYHNELPKAYWFDPKSDVWTPLAFPPQAAKNFRARGCLAVARLRSGVELGEAQARLNAINAQVQADHPESRGWGIKALMLHHQVVSGVERPIRLLFLAVCLVLAIACINVANLLLARGSARWREMALRVALGAGRGRLVRQLLTESLVLSLFGGILGSLLAWWGGSLIVKLGPADIPRLGETRINLTVLAFTLAVTLVTSVLFGLAPALRLSRPDLTAAFSEDSLRTGESRRARRFKGLMIAAQVALSITLLAGAGLLLRSYQRLMAVDLGYEKDAVLSFEMDIPRIKYQDGSPEIQVLLDRIFSRLDSLPGVEAAGGTSALPLLGWDQQSALFCVEGEPPPARGQEPRAETRLVTTGYFTAMNIRLIGGRLFDRNDNKQTSRVAIVGETLARKFFPNRDAIGKRLKMGPAESDGPLITIIGVVRDVRQTDVESPPRPQIYLPNAQVGYGDLHVVIRAFHELDSLANLVRGEMGRIDQLITIANARPLEQLFDQQIAHRRFHTQLLIIFAAGALALAAIGLYGQMSYAVAQRTHEIGVRRALGARTADILLNVIGQGMRWVFAGIGVGLCFSYVLGRFLESQLFDVRATDLTTMAAVTGLMLLVGLTASYIPARWAAKVDPAVALKRE